MGLESPTNPRDLNILWPLATDDASDGAAHLRGLKVAMKTLTALKSVQVFTSDGTWTKPTGILYVHVITIGGGGSGGAGIAATSCGAGGGGGARAEAWLDVSALVSVAIQVGVGGASVSSGNGNPGTESFFAATCEADPGVGGQILDAGHGGHRSNCTGTFAFSGGCGQSGRPGLGPGGSGGGRGAGAGIQGTGAPGDGNTGGGGSGGGADNSVGYASGAGGSGIVIVFEYGN